MGTYHHGNLREAALRTVDQVIRERGVGAVTLRDLGRRLGVSHAAVIHHFRSRAGVMTALAVEGHERLHDLMTEPSVKTFLDVGVAYVAFAAEHPSHFVVMFSPSLLITDDEALVTAQQRSVASLLESARGRGDGAPVTDNAAALAGWSMMHGLASLHVAGVLKQGALMRVEDTDGLLELARHAGGMLFQSRD